MFTGGTILARCCLIAKAQPLGHILRASGRRLTSTRTFVGKANARPSVCCQAIPKTCHIMLFVEELLLILQRPCLIASMYAQQMLSLGWLSSQLRLRLGSGHKAASPSPLPGMGNRQKRGVETSGIPFRCGQFQEFQEFRGVHPETPEIVRTRAAKSSGPSGTQR